ncbi:MAG: CPP1-like family protein [Chamaesiphon sp.]
MSDRSPYEKLGLTEDASFEEVQEAKAHLMQQHHDDQKLLENIESAYDEILMDRLKMRQQGKIKVPEGIRFAEKLSQSPPNFTQLPIKRSVSWLQELLDTPSRTDLLWSSSVFLGLGTWIAFPGFQEATLSLALAFGVGFTLFFVNHKERRLGRAALLTLLSLFVGIGLGTLFVTLQPTPIANISLTADKFITLVTFFILWLTTSFLH